MACTARLPTRWTASPSRRRSSARFSPFRCRLATDKPGAASAEPPHIHEVPFHRRGGRHLGAHEVGTPARALTAFEVAVRGRGAALARGELVVVHAQAHGAAG